MIARILFAQNICGTSVEAGHADNFVAEIEFIATRARVVVA